MTMDKEARAPVAQIVAALALLVERQRREDAQLDCGLRRDIGSSPGEVGSFTVALASA